MLITNLRHVCKFIIIISIIIINNLELLPQTQNFLKRSGRNIVNSNGDNVYLKGFNLGGWLMWEGWMWNNWNNPAEHVILDSLKQYIGEKETVRFWQNVHKYFITEQDLSLIKSSGFNCIRLPINYNLLMDINNGDSFKMYGFKLLDDIIDMCKQKQIYVVLDLHSVPGGQSFEPHADSPRDSNSIIWNNRQNQDRTAKLWKEIASRYKYNEIIAGYNLMNEPISPKGDLLVTIYNKIIKRIREEDKYHLIFLDGWFEIDYKNFKKIKDTNVVICCHTYADFGKSPFEALVNYDKISEDLNRPMWIGEWGSNNMSSIEQTIEDFNKTQFGFCGWAFWTWKRIPMENYPNPLVFNPNKEWGIITDLVNGGYYKNYSTKEIENALSGFIESLKFEYSYVDTSLIKILSK